jgi:PTS system mannitol-specific IIA component
MTDLLQLAGIELSATASSREEAVVFCGNKLVALGAVNADYVSAMWEREQILSSCLGEGFAIPHGTDASRAFVNFDQLVFVRFQEPIAWEDQEVRVCIGIAAKGDAHVDILGNLADLLMDERSTHRLLSSESRQEILDLVTGGKS